MGMFDIFRRENRISPALKKAVKDYRRGLAEAPKKAAETVEAIFGGLSDQEASILAAANCGLVDIPDYLAPRLELLKNDELELERLEAELGVISEDSTTATKLLMHQSWWPGFIAGVRQELGIRTAADIGRWGTHGKKITPYVLECGFWFQTPEAARKGMEGPVHHWSWRVDLKKGTSEPV